MSFVRLHGLSYAYEGRDAVLSDVDLHLQPGWTGLVGANGSGKTTLLGLLDGSLTPSSGHVRLESVATVRRCRQSPTLDDEVLAFGLDWSRDAQRWRARLALDPDRLESWETLSPGERRRWQIGAALAEEPDLLLLDEPSNHLDAGARDVLVEALRRYRGIGVLVSHDRALLDALTTRTVRLHHGRVREYPGAYGAARALWEAELAAARDARDAAQEAARVAARQLADARRNRAAAASQVSTSARMKDKNDSDARGILAKNLASWADARIGRDVNVLRKELEKREAAVDAAAVNEDPGAAIAFAAEPCPKRRLATLSGPLTIADRTLVAHLDVTWDRGDRVHLAGPNGAGKSTLLRALVAAADLGDRLLVVPQDLAGEDAGPTDLAALRELASDVRGRVLQIVAALGLDPARLLATGRPSPGEARKLRIAMGIGRGAWGLVLDEPTNDLDLPSVERLEAALKAWTGALLLVTHDPAFAAATTTSRWTLADGELLTIPSAP
jgi:ATPase subunit of ABC transporter with duplicated ATPase domains